MAFSLDKKVSDVRVWELYIGFVLLQLLIGVAITLLIGVFDLVGIRGALAQTVKQIGVVTNSIPLQSWSRPIASEVKEGKYF